MKVDEDDRKSDHTTPVQAKGEVVTHMTTQMNLWQGRQACVASSEIWLRDDLEEIYALLFRYFGYGFQLAMSNVGWFVTQKFVILVPDPIGFAPWSVLFGRGEPCDSCEQDTPPLAERARLQCRVGQRFGMWKAYPRCPQIVFEFSFCRPE